MGQYDSQDNNIPVSSTAQDVQQMAGMQPVGEVQQFEGVQQFAETQQTEQALYDAQQTAGVQTSEVVQDAECVATEGVVQNAESAQPAAVEASALGDSETPEYMIDAEGLVENGDSTVCLRCVEIVAFVLEHSCLAQHRKSVRKSMGDKELAVIVLRQFHGDVLAVCRTAFANVNGDIQNCALDAPYQFALRKRRSLKMQTPHHAVRRH